jgi:hypothetical protein
MAMFSRNCVLIKLRGFRPEMGFLFDEAARIARARLGCRVKLFFANGNQVVCTGEIVAHYHLKGPKAEVADITGLGSKAAQDEVTRAVIAIVEKYA